MLGNAGGRVGIAQRLGEATTDTSDVSLSRLSQQFSKSRKRDAKQLRKITLRMVSQFDRPMA